MLAIPGAMESGLDNVLFWGRSRSRSPSPASSFPVNRWLITRGKGHAVLHETGIHGGPNLRVVGALVAIAFVFGTAVLVNEAFSFNDEDKGHGDGHAAQLLFHRPAPLEAASQEVAR